MPIECQTRLLGDQFDGTATAGLWDFRRFNNLKRSTRITILTLSYLEATPGPVLTTDVEFFAVRDPAAVGVVPTEMIPLGRGLAAVGLLSPISGNAELKLCGIVLPRDADDGGLFWQILAFTKNKTQNASACVDYVICPFPETDERDSTEV